MRQNLKTAVIAMTVIFFMSQVCYADPSALLDWRKDVASAGDNLVLGTWKAASGFAGDDNESAAFSSAGRSVDYADLHKYLGFSAVILAGLAAVTSSSKGIHYGAAYGSTLAAAGAVTTGFMEYEDRYNHEDGIFARDNAHILLGTLGAIGCLAAVVMVDSDGGGGHAGAGIIGGSAMALSVITIKW
jgi:hypothetical protein